MLDGRPLRNNHWDAKGIGIIDDMTNSYGSKLRTFAQLKNAYGISKNFLKYIQIRSQLTRFRGKCSQNPWKLKFGIISRKCVSEFSKLVKNEMMNYSCVHRTYFPPVQLHKMGVPDLDLCWDCKQDKGHFYHMV